MFFSIIFQYCFGFNIFFHIKYRKSNRVQALTEDVKAVSNKMDKARLILEVSSQKKLKNNKKFSF